MGTVVLLHALGVGAGMWSEQARALTDAGHRVFAPDQRGYGTVPLGTDPPSLDRAADDVLRMLDLAGTSRVVLAGSSMGGYVAMAFLRRYPDRVAGLALLATRAAADSLAVAAGREALASMLADQRQAVLDKFVPSLLGATTRRRLLADVTSMVGAVPGETLAWSIRAVAGRLDSASLLLTVDLPSVVIAGAEDELVSADDIHELAAELRGSTLVTIPDAGHLTPLEAPEMVTKVLVDFLGAI
jgi:pimeloyl-ACP methyl ester carboxylesterase